MENNQLACSTLDPRPHAIPALSSSAKRSRSSRIGVSNNPDIIPMWPLSLLTSSTPKPSTVLALENNQNSEKLCSVKVSMAGMRAIKKTVPRPGTGTYPAPLRVWGLAPNRVP